MIGTTHALAAEAQRRPLRHERPAWVAPAQELPLEPAGAKSLRARLRRAKRTFTTRRVDFEVVAALSDADVRPQAGDLLLARVKRVRQHPRIENPEGRKVRIYPGDEIVLAYGNRYAPNQFEALVPPTLERCHLIAGGGVAATMGVRHSDMKPATDIEPIGLLLDATGAPVNLARFGLPERLLGSRPRVLAVVGSSMDAGKTTTAGFLIRGLSQAGLRVGAAKVTGTGSGGDVWHMLDAGATRALDFTDAGHASTYKLDAASVQSIFRTLCAELAAERVEVIVLEVADGLFQKETADLLRSRCFREGVDGVYLAVRDALAAAAGQQWLKAAELPLLGIAGLITTAPLSVREAKEVTGLEVFSESDLTDPERVILHAFASGHAESVPRACEAIVPRAPCRMQLP